MELHLTIKRRWCDQETASTMVETNRQTQLIDPLRISFLRSVYHFRFSFLILWVRKEFRLVVVSPRGFYNFTKFKEFEIEGSRFTSSDSRCDYETEFQEFPPRLSSFLPSPI